MYEIPAEISENVLKWRQLFLALPFCSAGTIFFPKFPKKIRVFSDLKEKMNCLAFLQHQNLFTSPANNKLILKGTVTKFCCQFSILKSTQHHLPLKYGRQTQISL